ncbi:MAG: hypothetical protein ABI895_35455, partial [Deltaproteobacteria bacterium]
MAATNASTAISVGFVCDRRKALGFARADSAGPGLRGLPMGIRTRASHRGVVAYREALSLDDSGAYQARSLHFTPASSPRLRLWWTS